MTPISRYGIYAVFFVGSFRISAYDNELIAAQSDLLTALEKRSECPLVAEIVRPEIAEKENLGHEFHLPFAAPSLKRNSLLAQGAQFRLESLKGQTQKNFGPHRKLQRGFATINENRYSDNFCTT